MQTVDVHVSVGVKYRFDSLVSFCSMVICYFLHGHSVDYL